MEWYLEVWKNYANFSGRARRKEYWMFQLFNAIIVTIFYILVLAVNPIFTVLLMLYALAIFIPSLAVTIRRLHDIGKSGVWFLIGFVPFIGGIWLFVLTCLGGDMCSNSYGPDPKNS